MGDFVSSTVSQQLTHTGGSLSTHKMDATDRPQIVEHVHKSLTYVVYDTRWVPSSARFVVLGCHPRGTGALQVMELRKGGVELVHESEKHAAFKCGTFGASSLAERHLATGDFDGRLSIWDLERTEMPVYSVKAHDVIVNAIDGCGGLNIGYGAPELVTGSRDGTVRVWDPRQRDTPVASLEPEEGSGRDCWSVAFGHSHTDEERCIVAGFDNGDVKLFDLRTNTIRWEGNVSNGACWVEFDRKNIEMNKLMVCSLESRFRMYDMRTFHPTKGYANMTEQAHKSTVWLGRFLPQNREIFATGGGNGNLNIYKYEYPAQRKMKDEHQYEYGIPGTVNLLQTKNLSTQPICSLDWHPDKTGLACMGSFDQSVRVAVISKLGIQ